MPGLDKPFKVLRSSYKCRRLQGIVEVDPSYSQGASPLYIPMVYPQMVSSSIQTQIDPLMIP
jgi:hypothetical protein